MYQDPFIVVVVVGIPADMVPLVDQQDALLHLGRQPFGEDASCKTGSDDEIVK